LTERRRGPVDTGCQCVCTVERQTNRHASKMSSLARPDSLPPEASIEQLAPPELLRHCGRKYEPANRSEPLQRRLRKPHQARRSETIAYERDINSRSAALSTISPAEQRARHGVSRPGTAGYKLCADMRNGRPSRRLLAPTAPHFRFFQRVQPCIARLHAASTKNQ